MLPLTSRKKEGPPAMVRTAFLSPAQANVTNLTLLTDEEVQAELNRLTEELGITWNRT